MPAELLCYELFKRYPETERRVFQGYLYAENASHAGKQLNNLSSHRFGQCASVNECAYGHGTDDDGYYFLLVQPTGTVKYSEEQPSP